MIGETEVQGSKFRRQGLISDIQCSSGNALRALTIDLQTLAKPWTFGAWNLNRRGF